VKVKARRYRRSDGDPVGGLGEWPRGSWPLWARWNGELDQRYTLGVEEELMLLEAAGWSLSQSSDRVLARLSDELSPHTFPETHAAVVEFARRIHPDVDGVVAELTSLPDRLSCELGAMGLAVAAAGTHPLTVRGRRPRSRARCATAL
jgi:gamma-glutamyl:cysteine ligase YbdK (ATP-grasp superfamily)